MTETVPLFVAEVEEGQAATCLSGNWTATQAP